MYSKTVPLLFQRLESSGGSRHINKQFTEQLVRTELHQTLLASNPRAISPSCEINFGPVQSCPLLLVTLGAK